ncbi:hypothetical protein Pfo_002041 [Paulownia fortunei]|nr:hypothetical protein Pfo_002041 [Paulownia fortunei]
MSFRVMFGRIGTSSRQGKDRIVMGDKGEPRGRGRGASATSNQGVGASAMPSQGERASGGQVVINRPSLFLLMMQAKDHKRKLQARDRKGRTKSIVYDDDLCKLGQLPFSSLDALLARDLVRALMISTAMSNLVSSIEDVAGRSGAAMKRNIEKVARHERKMAKMAKSFEELKSEYDCDVKIGERFL